MRRGQRSNAISNSPIVRAFIRPVLEPTLPVPIDPPPVAQPAVVVKVTVNPYLEILDHEAQPDERWLIPTQPARTLTGPDTNLGGRYGADEVRQSRRGPDSDIDAKGKKRAREEEEDPAAKVPNGHPSVPGHSSAAPEYDAATGTRFGVAVRYSEGKVPPELEKYWAQRYRLFSRFNEGCEMDHEGWYSVTPENLAAQIAERCRSGVIVDAFCGVGGNAIQFAMTCERVIALDTSPVRLACAAHNARLYGVADRITFVLGDWVAWTEAYAARLEAGQVPEEDRVEVVFLSPPWGGIDYQTTLSTGGAVDAAEPPSKRRRPTTSTTAQTSSPEPGSQDSPLGGGGSYPLSALAPLHGAALFALARRCTPHVALFLPRNVDLHELATLPGLGPDEKIEVEEGWMGWKCKAVTAYFGELAVGNGYVDVEEGAALE